MGDVPERPTTLSELARAMNPQLDLIATRAASAIRENVGSYRTNSDPTLDQQVFQHCRHVLEAMLECMVDDRSPVLDDFRFTTDVALSRVSQGIELPDFIRGFRLAQMTYWNHIVELLRDSDAPQQLITRTVEILLEVIEAGSSAAASSYLEAEQYRLADQDRLRRDLMEDLLEGRLPVLGPRRGMLTAAGLAEKTPFQMLSASLLGHDDDPGLGRTRLALRAALSRHHEGGAAGLIVVRHGEIIGMVRSTSEIVEVLQAARNHLRTEGLDVAVGLSTQRQGWDETAAAYREARLARRSLVDAPSPSGGVAALASMTPLAYLTLSGDATARQLVDPRITTFVADELASDGTHLATLEAYVAGDLNATAAAERLKVHVNTVYYRLDRVAERTGTDLRRFAEVMDLMVAVRLLRHV